MNPDLPPAGSVRPMPVLRAADVRELLLDWCAADPDDAETAAGAVEDLNGSALLPSADRMYQSIAADMGGRKWLQWPKTPAEQPLLSLYPLLAAIPLMRDFHRKLHLDEAHSRLILSDIGEKLRLNRRLYGRARLDVGFWFTAHLRGTLFQLGRLQFCLEGTEDEPFLGLHIRGEGGPLSIDAVRDSIEQALRFFPGTFPERFGGVPRFRCESWLLDPQLADWLPERSNILKFGALFDLEPPAGFANGWNDIWRFVFARPENTPAEKLPRENTLQQSIYAGIESGVRWEPRFGDLNLSRLGL